MKTLRFVRWAVCFTTSVAFLAGCSVVENQPSLGGSSMAPTDAHVSQLSKIFAMTNVMHQGLPAVKGHVAHSWMKRVPKGTTLLYSTDDPAAAVDVYDYPSGAFVGQATGFSNPFGLCSDKRGNVYVADFAGKAYEIQAGTTTVINSWTVGGYPDGCSVSNKGDLAVSDFAGSTGPSGSGSVTIFPGGGATGTNYPGPAYDWAPTYDKRGNLFVECAYVAPCSSPSIFELPAGGSAFRQLTLSGAKIGFASAVALEGKYVGVGDQEPSSQYALGIYESTLSGTTLTVKMTTIDSGSASCSPNAASWANYSKNPNGIQTHGIKATLTSCGTSEVGIWKFPAGGAPSGGVTLLNGAGVVTLIKT